MSPRLHTPEAWHYKSIRRRDLLRTGGGSIIAGDTNIATVWSTKDRDEDFRTPSDAEAEANGRLIAAAPLLLVACDDLLVWLLDSPECGAAIESAAGQRALSTLRAARAAATGGQQ